MAQDGKKKKNFFKEFRAELKKVIWPTPKQLINGTVAVIIIVLVTALIVLGLDSTFRLFNKYGIENFKKTIVDKRNDANNEVKNDDEYTLNLDSLLNSVTPEEVDNGSDE